MGISAALKWSGPVAGLALAMGCASPAAPPVVQAPAPTFTAVSPSPAPQAVRTVQPPGAACTEMLDALIEQSKTPWRLRDDAVIDDDDRSKPGVRSCEAETSSTAKSPPAILSILLYRPNPDYDTPAKVLERARRRDNDCTTPLPGPPDGVTLALGCSQLRGSTLTTSSTLLAGETGFVSVYVSAQHSGTRAAIAQGRSFAEDTSRGAAALAFPLI